jgi:polysaccharide biosynthesis/export protein
MNNELDSRVIGSVLLVMLLTGCGTTIASLTLPNGQGVKQANETRVSEINNAIATIATQTSLPPADYQIGSEDQLQITLYNIPPSEAVLTPRSVTARVSQQGQIMLPLLGAIKVSGLTTAMVERELARRYDRYIQNPEVGVLIAEYRQRVSVIGAVLKPGVVELTAPKTVFDVLAMVGGVTDRAGTQVHIYRQGPNGRETQIIDLLAIATNASLITANAADLITMPVQAGDVVNVPPAGMFFIDGAVGRPGSYPLGRHYSLTQALSLAGGVNRDLNSNDITIFRRKASSAVEPITVDLDSILAGSASDPKIEDDDVIMVPISTAKYVYQRVFGQLLGWGLSIGSIVH